MNRLSVVLLLVVNYGKPIIKRLLTIIILLWGISGTNFAVASKNYNQNLTSAKKILKKYGKDGGWDKLDDAVQLLKKAADEDNGEACFILSRIYSLKSINDIYIDRRDVARMENGYHYQNDWDNIVEREWSTHKIAWEYLTKACELENQDALLTLADEYAESDSSYPIERDIDKALELFIKLEKKNDYILYRIGNLYWIKGDDEEAIKWMTKASQIAPYKALPELAFIYSYKQDYKNAVTAWEKWVKIDKFKSLKPSTIKLSHTKIKSHGTGMYKYFKLLNLYVLTYDWMSAINLSKKLDSDIKTLEAKDIVEYNLSKNTELNSFRNLFNVLEGYSRPRYILDSIAIEHGNLKYIKEASEYLYEEEKYEQAYKYLTLDSDNTDHHLLGLCYYYGNGTDINYDEAFNNLTLCNDFDSLYHLGLCYYNQQGVPQDYNKAFDYFSKAVSSPYGSIGAMEMLSRCYRFGRGCEIDEEKADHWLEQAAKASEQAKKAINALRSSESNY